MKIEKINDRQIRCTLTREDLEHREIKLSELAYGSEKAKALFQDMMQVAAEDFGFEADNTPLVIEAVPVSVDAIVLIITKVEDPEELDTRFARFSPEDTNAGDTAPAERRDKIEGADSVLGMIQKLTEAQKQKSKEASKTEADRKKSSASAADDEALRNLTKCYQFRSLDNVIRAAEVLGSVYEGPNTLYKNPENNHYYLLLKKASTSAEQFNKVCNVLSEYGFSYRFAPGMEAHFSEHMQVILAQNALQSLALLN